MNQQQLLDDQLTSNKSKPSFNSNKKTLVLSLNKAPSQSYRQLARAGLL